MPSELQEAEQLGGCIFPNISTPTTSLLQEQAIQPLRKYTVISFKKLSDEHRRICRIMTHNTTLNNHSGSVTEKTIVQHANPETEMCVRLLSMKDGNTYSTNPTNGYSSQWVDGFQGCLARGSTNHRFTTCLKKNDPNTKILFWQKFWAHVPSTRRRKSEPIPKLIVDANPSSN